MTPTRTRRIKAWPFPISVSKSGVVTRNVPPPRPKPKRLKKVPPSDQWTQQEIA